MFSVQCMVGALAGGYEALLFTIYQLITFPPQNKTTINNRIPRLRLHICIVPTPHSQKGRIHFAYFIFGSRQLY